jgi:hypothetical protein
MVANVILKGSFFLFSRIPENRKQRAKGSELLSALFSAFSILLTFFIALRPCGKYMTEFI